MKKKIKKKSKVLSMFLVVLVVIGFFPITAITAEAQAANVKIGDYIQFGTYYDEPILWRVIDLDEDGDPLLYSERILGLKPFDARGDYQSGTIVIVVGSNNDSNRIRYGSNYWKNSNIRQWLNSTKENIDWIQNEPNVDNIEQKHNPYNNEPGFLSDNNFTEKERSMIKPREHKAILSSIDRNNRHGGIERLEINTNIKSVVQNYNHAYYEIVEDKVFFLSIKEIKQLVHDRGWEYRKKPTERAVENSTYKHNNLSNDEYWNNWLRTPVVSSYGVRNVHRTGGVTSRMASTGEVGFVPALSLNLSSAIFKSGSGTKSAPYIITEGERQGKVREIDLKISNENIIINEGDSTNINLTTSPTDANLTYSSSDNWIATVSQDGIITGHRQGTAVISIKAEKAGYASKIKTVYVDVQGLKNFDLVIEPRVFIMEEGDIAGISANLPVGTYLEASVDHPNIVSISIDALTGRVQALNKGESQVGFKAQKQGYKDGFIAGSIVVIERENRTPNYIVPRATNHWHQIPAGDRNTRVVRERIFNEAEKIIRSTSQMNLSVEPRATYIDRSVLDEIFTVAVNTEKELNKVLSDLNINMSRNLSSSVLIKLNNTSDEITNIGLNAKDFANIDKSVRYIYLQDEKSDMIVGLDTREIEAIFTQNERFYIQLEKEQEGYQIVFKDGNGNKIDRLRENIIVIFPFEGDNPYYNSVFKIEDDEIIQIGGNYEGDMEGIMVQIRSGGRYYVAEKIPEFTDIHNKDEEMKRAIAFLSARGIVTGMPDGRFNPDGTLTRAEFTTMLVRSFYALDRNLSASFNDVYSTDWHHDYVASSKNAKIVNGYPDGTFKPNNIIEKEQMIALVSRALANERGYNYPANENEYLIYYNDRDNISEWAREEVALSVRERMVDIPQNRNLEPNAAATRGEAARVLYRLFVKLY